MKTHSELSHKNFKMWEKKWKEIVKHHVFACDFFLLFKFFFY